MHYVGNQPRQAQHHFYGLREAKKDIRGIAIYDRLDGGLQGDPNLVQEMWVRREIENYLCSRATLLVYAQGPDRMQPDLFTATRRRAMQEAIDEIASALAALGKPDPWSYDLKASDDFLDPLFRKYHEKLGLPDLMRKTDYHTLAPYVPAEDIDPEVREKLDAIDRVAHRACPREGQA